MATVETIINRALRLNGSIASGEGGSPEELADGLVSLNTMLKSWDSDRLTVYAKRRDVVNLSNGTQTYTVGIGGALNIPRPVSLLSVAAVSSSGLALPMELIGAEDWGAIVEKTVSGTMPRKLYNNNAYPLATFYIWPVPSGVPQLDIYAWIQLTQFVAISDAFDFPPGYELAIVSNLAMQIAPEYGRGVTADLGRMAQASLMNLQKLNLPPIPGNAEEAMARVQASASVPGMPPGTMPPAPQTVRGQE